mgnify:CR=1 FL=1
MKRDMVAPRLGFRHDRAMRTALALTCLVIASPATAQSATFLAHAALESCVQERSAAYAGLDGSLREIVTAALGACRDERSAVKDAYREHYEGLGAAAGTAVTQAADMVDVLVRDLSEAAMATVAEARLAGG